VYLVGELYHDTISQGEMELDGVNVLFFLGCGIANGGQAQLRHANSVAFRPIFGTDIAYHFYENRESEFSVMNFLESNCSIC